MPETSGNLETGAVAPCGRIRKASGREDHPPCPNRIEAVSALKTKQIAFFLNGGDPDPLFQGSPDPARFSEERLQDRLCQVGCGKIFPARFENELHADFFKQPEGRLRGKGREDVFDKVAGPSLEVGGFHFPVGDIAPRPARHEDLRAKHGLPIQKENGAGRAVGPGAPSCPNRGRPRGFAALEDVSGSWDCSAPLGLRCELNRPSADGSRQSQETKLARPRSVVTRPLF